MLWLWLALIPAITVAVRDVSIKTYDDLTPMRIAGIELFYSLPLFCIGLAMVEIPPLDNIFWWTFILSLPLNIFAYLLYIFAIKCSPISLSVPFLAFTPVFMLATGLVVLHEKVNLWGAAGVGIIVIGSYILHLGDGKSGLLEPFRSFAREKGSWLMLIVALLFAFAAVVGKMAMLHSSPLFFSFLFFLIFNLVILAGLLTFRKCLWRDLMQGHKRGIWLGSLLAVHIIFHALAIVESKAVYMISVKRCSVLFSVLLSWIVLREGNRFARGIGVLCMVLGVLLLSLWG